jgi:hypothetical protein
MAFPGMNDEHAEAAGRRQHLLARADRGFEPGDVIAERRTEPARLEEIALHIDDDECAAVELEVERGGFGEQVDARHAALLWVWGPPSPGDFIPTPGDRRRVPANRFVGR